MENSLVKIKFEESKSHYKDKGEFSSNHENKENNSLNINGNIFTFKNELLEFFLSFLSCKSELNYVLSGYFARFFNTLLTKNASFVISL